MLQQILKEMYIDPDVLEALNEEQKKTLFLKMRQEQVRRWKEREEKLEKEERGGGGGGEARRPKTRKGSSKSVSWMLGRDGEVAVAVIGEVDELKSKFISSGFTEKKSPSQQNNSCHQTILKSRKPSEAVRPERDGQPGISLNLQGKAEEAPLRPLPGAVRARSPPPAAAAAEQAELQSRSPPRSSGVQVRAASANTAPGCVNARVGGLANVRPASATLAAADTERRPTPTAATQKNQEAAAGVKDVGASGPFRRGASEAAGPSGSSGLSGPSVAPPPCAGRGRVAQLMKAFSVDCTTTTTPTAANRIKPPLPSKPGHLRAASSPPPGR